MPRLVVLRLYYHHSRARKVFNLRLFCHERSNSPDLGSVRTTYDRTTSSSYHCLTNPRHILSKLAFRQNHFGNSLASLAPNVKFRKPRKACDRKQSVLPFEQFSASLKLLQGGQFIVPSFCAYTV